jgi:hypothetical protein
VSFSDLRHLPPAVVIAFVLILWPAIWAAAAMVMAFVTDILRRMERRDTLRHPAEVSRFEADSEGAGRNVR